MKIDSALRSLRNRLSLQQRSRVKRFLNTRLRGAQHVAQKLLFGSNLDILAIANCTDKNTVHRYTQHYARHLAPYRKKRVNLLEIGIGGYDDVLNSFDNPALGGDSLRMWRTYFPKGRIFGIDVCDKSTHNERRIKTFQGSPADTT